ncbi:MAG TPA: hypothetical protein VG320_16650 [Paraburkholderia sp.]|jgi:hypothetical protein|uniref:hypothetical protein n=1 Tax=Paraburkholderia sp. TaxID=1926495 RepID=UPI002DF36DA9|nr:hypothetical protein [Paraburkholderia sp.]
MNTDTYTDIRKIDDFPSFHDAELYGVEHDPRARSVALRFRRAGGEFETLKFSGLIAQRMIDFAGQNVASRLLISHRYAFTLVEIRKWIQWIDSRDDSTAAVTSEERGQEYMRDFAAGRRMLFVLEPSCGAEMAILCESVSLGQ